MPVFGAIAARFNDDGVTALYQETLGQLKALGLRCVEDTTPLTDVRYSTDQRQLIPANRIRYLSDIAETIREYKSHSITQANVARERQQLTEAAEMLKREADKDSGAGREMLRPLIEKRTNALTDTSRSRLDHWPEQKKRYQQAQIATQVRDRELVTALTKETLSGTPIPRVALPTFEDHGTLLKWLLLDNLPGYFPFTAGVFPFKTG